MSKDDGMAEYREACAIEISKQAAKLVAAGDMSRKDAISAATEWQRRAGEALGDVTGVLAIENTLPTPSKEAPPAELAAIEKELLDDARDAADTL